MRIAVLSVLHSQVAAATAGVRCAPVVAAQTPITAGQQVPAAIHPTSPVPGCTRPLRDFGARLLHLVGDNTSGVSRGSGRAASAADDRKAPPVNQTSVRDFGDGSATTGHVDPISEHLGAGDRGDQRAHRQRNVAPAQLVLDPSN